MPKLRLSDVEIQQHREMNVRLLLIRATRCANRQIALELQRRGFPEMRAGHSVLLANLTTHGNSVTELAERAQISKQSMSRLAVELEGLGLITRRRSKKDARALLLCFTTKGVRLVRATVQIVTELERDLEMRVGTGKFSAFQSVLMAMDLGTSES